MGAEARKAGATMTEAEITTACKRLWPKWRFWSICSSDGTVTAIATADSGQEIAENGTDEHAVKEAVLRRVLAS